MDFSSFTPQELMALGKALHFVRFESQEPGASAVAGIPALGQLHAQALETLWTKVETTSTAFFRAHGFPDVTADPERVTTVEGHLRQVERWNDLSETAKRGYLHDLVFPFAVDPQTVERLLQYGDHFHRSQV